MSSAGDTNKPENAAGAPRLVERLIASMSLIVIVSYAPFSIAALLAERLPTAPLGFLVSMVFLSMAIGTVLSAALTKTGLVVAPAIGIASFVHATRIETINTTQLLLATFFAGLIAFWLSRSRKDDKPSLRQLFLNNLPRPVIVGVRGGVGALLASAAVYGLEEVRSVRPDLYAWTVGMFVLAVPVLLFSDIAQQRIEREAKSVTIRDHIYAFVLASMYVVVPILILWALYMLGAFPLPNWSGNISLPQTVPIFQQPLSNDDLIKQVLVFISFTSLILFVFLTDIPGSPYDVFKTAEQLDKKTEARIDRSFLVTSCMSMLNPFAGLFTSVYYAENHVVVRDGESFRRIIDHPWTAWFCGAAFFILAAIFAFLQFPVRETRVWFLIAVAPALFCVGIRITARAMQRDFLEEHGRKAGHLILSSFFVPVSLTVLLTHFIGFELALPIGIAYFGLSAFTISDDWKNDYGWQFVLLWIGSLFIALVMGLVRLQSLSIYVPKSP